MTATMKTVRSGLLVSDTSLVIRSAGVCWAGYEQASGNTIPNSYNVASITDNGAGIFTVNFTNSRADKVRAFDGTAHANDHHVRTGAGTETNSEDGASWDISLNASEDSNYTMFVGGELA